MEYIHTQEAMIERRNIPKPIELRQDYPLSQEAIVSIKENRSELQRLMRSPNPDRIIAVIGFCSLDNLALEDGSSAALEYGAQLATFLQERSEVTQHVQVILRCPPAKPRSNFGWRGLEHSDPVRAFELLTELANMQLPLAIECLSERHPQYYGDMLTMGWLGARDVESTDLRYAMAAGTPFPLFLKNSTHGSLDSALRAKFLIQDPEKHKEDHEKGSLATNYNTGQLEQLIDLPGTQDVGIIMRGGTHISSPEIYEKTLLEYCAEATQQGFALLADASHGGAMAHGGKHADGQEACLQHIMTIKENGTQGLSGVMIESHLNRGAQKGVGGYSQTDEGLSITETCHYLEALADIQSSLQASA